MAIREDTTAGPGAGAARNNGDDARQGGGPPGARTKKRRLRILRWAGTLILIVAIFSVIPFSEVAAALRRVNLGYFLAGLALTIANIYSEAVQLWVLLKRVSVPVTPWRIFETNITTRFYGQFLPSDLLASSIKFYRLSAPTRQYGEVVASLVFFRVANMLVLAVSGMAFWAIEMPEGPGRWVGLLLAAIIGGLVTLHLALSSPAIQQGMARIVGGKLFSWLQGNPLRKLEQLAGSTASSYRLFKGVVWLILAMAALRHAVGILSFSMLARSLDIDLSMLTIGWIRAVMQAVLMLPISVSGIGVREGSLILLLQEYDVSAGDAVALAFLLLAVAVIANALGGALEIKNLLRPGRDVGPAQSPGGEPDKGRFGRPFTPWRGRLYLTLQEVRGRPVARFMRELEKWEVMDNDSFARLHEERLERAVRHARNHVPLFRTERWSNVRCTGRGFLQTWPAIGRDTLNESLNALFAEPRPERVVSYRTSGSMGRSREILWTMEGEAWWWAQRYRALEWHGIPVGIGMLRLTHRRRALRDLVLGHHSERSLHEPGAVDRAVRYLEREGSSLVMGSPSALFYLARCLRERGVKAPLARWARVGGEPLFEFQRAEIERYLAARVVNSYGCTEIGAIASECPAGSMHVLSDFVHLEILNGLGRAGPGEFGEIAATVMHNTATPLVRYRTGDGARLLDERCPCGLPQPVITDLRARVTDVFEGPGGALRHAADVCSGMGAFFADQCSEGVRQFQLIQVTSGHWEAFLETADGTSPGSGAAARIEQVLGEVFGSACRVEVRMADRIAPDQGKMRYCRRAS